MLIHPTVERLRALGLTAMADAFIELQNAPDAGELSREDWLGVSTDVQNWVHFYPSRDTWAAGRP